MTIEVLICVVSSQRYLHWSECAPPLIWSMCGRSNWVMVFLPSWSGCFFALIGFMFSLQKVVVLFFLKSFPGSGGKSLSFLCSLGWVSYLASTPAKTTCFTLVLWCLVLARLLFVRNGVRKLDHRDSSDGGESTFDGSHLCFVQIGDRSFGKS